MFLSYSRMVVGSPLQYQPTYLPYEDSFLYFRYFDPYNRLTMESSEEYLMRSSPFSIQSDSDTSICSVELSPKPIRGQKPTPKIEESTRCGWRNCGLDFASLEQLAAHLSKSHSSSGPGGLFYCEWEGCNRNHKGFNARYKMLVHVRTHTNEKPHKCPLCQKSFSRAENLKIHSRSHSGEKPYVCTVEGCNKAYSNSSDRFKHTRTHSVEKPYQCKVVGCNKRYTDPSSLRKHVKTYKHFVNENNFPLDNQILLNSGNGVPILEHPEIFKHDSSDSNQHETTEKVARVSVITNTNDIAKFTPKTDDIYRLGSFLDIKADTYTYLESYESKNNFFKPYEYEPNPRMEVDEVPLDLSIRRGIS